MGPNRGLGAGVQLSGRVGEQCRGQNPDTGGGAAPPPLNESGLSSETEPGGGGIYREVSSKELAHTVVGADKRDCRTAAGWKSREK